MSEPQYPPYPPNYSVVEHTGGLRRVVFVLELLTEEDPPNTTIAKLKEEIEYTCAKHNLKGEVIASNRFDTQLRQALRTRLSD